MSIFLNLYISNLNNIVIGVGEMTHQGRVLVVLLEDWSLVQAPIFTDSKSTFNSNFRHLTFNSNSNAFFIMQASCTCVYTNIHILIETKYVFKNNSKHSNLIEIKNPSLTLPLSHLQTVQFLKTVHSVIVSSCSHEVLCDSVFIFQLLI